jgi:hypothetical protein
LITPDQRGIARPQDGNEDGTVACDIGAFEVASTGCPVGADLTSILCRLAEVRLDVEAIADVPARVRLLRPLVKGQTQAGAVERTRKAKRKKVLLAKTSRSLAKFVVRLHSPLVVDAVPSDVLGGFETVAASIRNDVLAVRGSL